MNEYEVKNKINLAQLLVQVTQYLKFPVLNEGKHFYLSLYRFKISKMVLQGVSLLGSDNGHILTDMT